MRAALVGLALLLLLFAILPIWALLSKAFQAKDGSFVGLDNFVRFIATPSLAASVGNSLFVATVSTVICITLAFLYAYGLSGPGCLGGGYSCLLPRSRCWRPRFCRRSASFTCSATRGWRRAC